MAKQAFSPCLVTRQHCCDRCSPACACWGLASRLLHLLLRLPDALRFVMLLRITCLPLGDTYLMTYRQSGTSASSYHHLTQHHSAQHNPSRPNPSPSLVAAVLRIFAFLSATLPISYVLPTPNTRLVACKWAWNILMHSTRLENSYHQCRGLA